MCNNIHGNYPFLSDYKLMKGDVAKPSFVTIIICRTVYSYNGCVTKYRNIPVYYIA